MPLRFHLLPVLLSGFLLGLILPAFAFGQNQDFLISERTISRQQGLVSKQVHCGVQDSDGFVWLGTAQGLQRYDGQKFILYTREKNGLQDNYVISVQEDFDHNLWILYGYPGTVQLSNGKCDVLNLKTGKLKSLHDFLGKRFPELRKGFMTEIQATVKKELIITFFPVPNKLETWRYGPQGVNKIADELIRFRVRNAVVVALTRNQKVVEFNMQGRVLSEQEQVVNGNSTDYLGELPDGNTGFCSFPLRQGNHLSDYQFFTLNRKTGKKMPLPSLEGSGIQVPDLIGWPTTYDVLSGNSLLTNGKGELVILDGQHWISLNQRSEQPDRPKTAGIVFGYFTTRDGQHWVCSNDGLKIFTITKRKFRHLLSQDVISFPNISDHQTRTICEDSSGLFILCWNGLYWADRTDRSNLKCLIEGTMSRFYNGFFDDGENLWLANSGENYYKCHKKSRTITKISGARLPLMYCSLKMPDGKMLAGCNESVYEFRDQNFFPLSFCDTANTFKYWTFRIVHSPDGKIFAATNIGLLEINESFCVRQLYHERAKDKKCRIPATEIHDVYIDKKGIFWLATNGNGLIQWNRSRGTFKQYTVADGLSSNSIHAILEDASGRFWMSSDYGVMQFDPRNGFVRTYTEEDGLSNNEMNRSSAFQSEDGTLFFGGLDGVNMFHPRDFGNAKGFEAPLKITSYHLFSSATNELKDLSDSLSNTNEITMRPENTFFTLEFQLLDFRNGRHQYAYQIEGIDKAWNHISENSVRFSGLPYGDYVIRIKGQDETGHWSARELRIPLRVLAPFYRQTWFILTGTLLLLLVVWLFFLWRTRRLRNRNTVLERSVKERTVLLESTIADKEVLLNEKDVLLKEIHHRVKNNLQVISGLIELQSKSVGNEDLKTALMEGRNRVQSIALIHQNLYQNTDLSHIEMGRFIQELEREVSLVFRRENLKVNTTVETPDLILDIDTAVPLGLIINELLSNSFKYAFTGSTEGIIRLVIENRSPGEFALLYSDSGPGLPDSVDLKKSSTLGLQLISDLTRQIGGKLHYDKEANQFNITFIDKETRKLRD